MPDVIISKAVKLFGGVSECGVPLEKSCDTELNKTPEVLLNASLQR